MRVAIVAVVTFMVGLLLGQTRSLVPSAPTEAVAPPPAPAAPPAPECLRLAELRSKMSEAGRQGLADELAKVREARGESPAPWPTEDDMMGEVHPANFVGTLKDASKQLQAEVLWTDCSEYPCLAVVRGGEGLQAQLASTNLSARVEQRGPLSVVVSPDDTTSRLGRRIDGLLFALGVASGSGE